MSAAIVTVGLLAGCSSSGGGSGTGSVSWDSAPTELLRQKNIELAFNNTYIGGRDVLGVLHLVWTDHIEVWHGMVPSGSSGFTSTTSLPHSGLVATPWGRVSKPTLAFTGGGTILVAYTVHTATNTLTLYVSRSTDLGMNWDLPVAVTSGDIESSVSLRAYLRQDGTPGAVLAWYDATTTRVRSSAWLGTAWTSANWTSPVALASGGSGTQSHDVSLGGNGETILAAWEDDRAGSGHKIFVRGSADGGQTWWASDERLNVVTTGTPSGDQQDPGVAIRSDGTVVLAHQNLRTIYLTRSTDGGHTFESYTTLGSGLFAHTAVNDRGVIAVSWEYFTGTDNFTPFKTTGLALSLDDLGSIDAPHAMPDSDAVFQVVQSAVMVRNSAIDVVWVDTSQASSTPSTVGLEWRSGLLP